MKKKIDNIISEIFLIKLEEISDDLTADDIDGWDSLSHMQLISEVEKKPNSNPFEILKKIRIKTAAKQIGIDEKKIIFIRHEECHQYYGYFSQNNFIDNVLVFTIEGGGDDSSATVSIAKKGTIKEKYKTKCEQCSIKNCRF